MSPYAPAPMPYPVYVNGGSGGPPMTGFGFVMLAIGMAALVAALVTMFWGISAWDDDRKERRLMQVTVALIVAFFVFLGIGFGHDVAVSDDVPSVQVPR